ncbi:MAG: alpha/beta hydrolase [Candidatus Neomarinimicrobiota bacterium]
MKDQDSLVNSSSVDLDLSSVCTPGCKWNVELLQVTDSVILRIMTFNPPQPVGNPTVVFVAGWISRVVGWEPVLKEMTKDFRVIYVETREKISSQVHEPAGYGVAEIAQDLVEVVKRFDLRSDNYVFFGSSLGATAILHSIQYLDQKPRALTLIGTNATFSMSTFARTFIRFLPPRLYLIARPFIKWYLKTFRLKVRNDDIQFKKYSAALDAADPWKLKKGAIALSTYEVWDLLKDISVPTLLIGASEDNLHDHGIQKRMADTLPNGKYLELKTNTFSHSGMIVVCLRDYLKELGS